MAAASVCPSCTRNASVLEQLEYLWLPSEVGSTDGMVGTIHLPYHHTTHLTLQ